MAGRAIRGAWVGPALFMAVAGFWHINRPEMWQDELVTISVVSRSTRQILSLLRHVDAVHGAYYLFMHGWVQIFGQSSVALRTPSALAMAGAAACVTVIGQRLFSRSAGVLGGFVFALVPAVTRFAQEARSYAFVVLFAALATLFLIRALERPSVPRWLCYAASLTAITCVNTVALSIVVGHLVGILVSRYESKRRLVLWCVLAAVAGVVPASPVIYLGIGQATRQISWVNAQPHAFWVVWPRTFASGMLAWTITALAILAVMVHRRRAVFAAAMALAPPLLIWLVSLGKLNYFFSKYLLFAIPAWAVLAGAGLAALRLRKGWVWAAVPAAGVAALAILSVPGQIAMRGDLSHSYYTYPQPRPSEPLAYREAAAVIAAHYQPGDGIVYTRQHWWLMHDVGVPYYLPENVKPRDIFREQSAAAADDLTAIECPVAASCFHDERRVWVVLPYRARDVVGQMVHEQGVLFATRYSAVLTEYPVGMTVVLLQRT